MYKHILQSEEWAKIRTKYGTEAIRVGDIFYTKSKIPKTNLSYAYCPRVDPRKIDFEKLKKSLKENKCIAINFDVPNVEVNSGDYKEAKEIFESHCVKASRSELAKANVILNLEPSEKTLFKNLHKKHRYNARLAMRKGVTVRLAENISDLDVFYDLYVATALRQSYFVRPKKYFEIIWNELFEKNMCQILIAEYKGEPLAAWMIFIYEEVLYYPYGGSSEKNRNVFASNALGWEVIRYGKSRGCKIFDMWGAAENSEDTEDDYHGFTTFKLRFGAKHVKYIDSYALAINKPLYYLFTIANKIRWKLLDLGLIK